jgi:hypothetical protein
VRALGPKSINGPGGVEKYRRRDERNADFPELTWWAWTYLDTDFLNMRSIFSLIASIDCWLLLDLPTSFSTVVGPPEKPPSTDGPTRGPNGAEPPPAQSDTAKAPQNTQSNSQ